MARNPKFVFSTSAFCYGATQRHGGKVECGCTTTNLPLSNNINTISKFERRNGTTVSTNFAIHKDKGQKQKIELFWPSWWYAKWKPQHTVVIQQQVLPFLHFSDFLESDTISLLVDAENFWETTSLTPITSEPLQQIPPNLKR